LPQNDHRAPTTSGVPPSRPSIAVVGSINLDLVAGCSRLPAPGETVAALSFGRYPGGKGANQAVAAARLGANVRMVGCVGRDANAQEALAGLRDAEVELDVRESEAPTGVALILVDRRGQNEIAVWMGANAEIRDFDVSDVDAVLCQLEVPDVVVKEAAEQARFFCLNAAPAFASCLLVSHLEGRSWPEALRRACAAGALAASRPGAQPSLPTAAEVEEILRGA
jgi:ribokinase